MAVTSDNQNLVTCSDDGSMCFWRLGEGGKQQQQQQQQQGNASAQNPNHECLILRIDWCKNAALLDNTTRQLEVTNKQLLLNLIFIKNKYIFHDRKLKRKRNSI